MQRKTLIAPILITVLFCLWTLSWAAVCLIIPELPLPMKLIGLIVPVGLLGVMIYVLLERIHEIRSGDEDDLSNY